MTNRSVFRLAGITLFALTISLTAGCKSTKCDCCTTETTPTTTSAATTAAPAEAVAPSPAAAPAPVVVAPKTPLPTIRIAAGRAEPYTDTNGNVWLADQGFADGEIIARDSSLEIKNTNDPQLYRTEHYSMTAFSQPVPNGSYTVKLHFAETFEEINGPGQRVFSFNVEGKEFKNFDVFVKAGGIQRAYVETVNVDVTDGKLDITFAMDVQNPEINGIEILPGS